MSAARSLNDIAQDLTENGASKISKGHLGIKNQLIMASNGSLGSTGRTATEPRRLLVLFHLGQHAQFWSSCLRGRAVRRHHSKLTTPCCVRAISPRLHTAYRCVHARSFSLLPLGTAPCPQVTMLCSVFDFIHRTCVTCGTLCYLLCQGFYSSICTVVQTQHRLRVVW